MIEDDEGVVSIEWADHLIFDDGARNYVRRLFRRELRRLYRFQNVLYNMPSNETSLGIPQHEWDAIQGFYQATKTALKYAIYSLVNDEDITCDEGVSSSEGVCAADKIDVYEIHYDDLGDEEDNLEYIFPDCGTTQLTEFWEYEEREILQTNYQKLTFVEREADKDVCMNLENTLQICSSYRPHYHEFFVHFPARYIDTVKRVIFIGGGDSMLLHEVLKYPTLEKVVGLELDQQVTRKSFEYFHSQPHYDNDKVEWWYGDATKSLPLLPKDYWGSFDLVLVDLSETVMSMSVTGELDIFAALSLLLKPEGIMVKNEPYLDTFSQFFDYSIHVFYGTPKICTQVLSMGSNKVDFLHHPVREHHDVERLLLEPLEDDEIRYKYMHDFLKTDARAQGKCLSSEDISVKHGKKAGILEIIDADKTSVPLDASLEQKLLAVIEQQGLSLVLEPTCEDGTFVFVLKEGYIILRAWPDQQYCGIDVNLWGSFQKQESIRTALVEAVGSTSVSSFRIVVGGMHGASTWEDDKEVIGIQVAQTRNCEERVDSEDSSVDVDLIAAAFDAAVTGLVDSFFPQNSVVAVACGYEDGDECSSLKGLSEHSGISKVVPIWTCPDLTKNTDYTVNSDMMYVCEISIHAQMEAAFGQEGSKADAFVLDNDAPFVMGQIFQSLFSLTANREEWLTQQHVLFAPILEESESRWRQNFMEKYRKEKHLVPVTRAETEIRAGVSKRLLSLGVSASNDAHFFTRVTAFEKGLLESMSKYGNIEVETPTIFGGVKYFEEEYNAKIFAPNAYDPTPAVEQAAAQVPLGRQSVFQFEFPEEDDGSRGFDTISGFLQTAFEKLGYVSSKQNRYTGVGDGGVVVATFADGGGLLLIWDGQSHVDINLFSTDGSRDRADKFLAIITEVSGLQRTLRDDQPRGTGRVIQFQSEI
jgi:spermidine synthase